MLVDSIFCSLGRAAKSHKTLLCCVAWLTVENYTGKSSIAKAFQEHCPLPFVRRIEYDGIEDSLLSWSSSSTQRTADATASASALNNKVNDGTSIKNSSTIGDVASEEELEQRLEAWRQSRKVALDQLKDILISSEKEQATVSTDGSSSSAQKSNTEPSSNLHHRHQQAIVGRFQGIIIMDDNYYLRSMRKQVFLTCQQSVAAVDSSTVNSNNNVYMVSVFVDTPLEVCLERNQGRSGARRIPSAVIRRMAEQMEPPGNGSSSGGGGENDDDTDNREPKRNFHWEQVVWRLDGSQPNRVETNVQDLLHRLISTHDNDDNGWLDRARVPPPVDPQLELNRLAAERKLTRDNIRHQIDVALRRAVKVVAEINSKHARVANAVRKEIMSAKSSDDGSTGITTLIENSQDALQHFIAEFLKREILDESEEESLRRRLLEEEKH